MSKAREFHGCMALFETPAALLEAVRMMRAAGCREIEVYSPCALEANEELLSRQSNGVAWSAFFGGLIGGLGTLGLQYYAAVFNYPIRVGGRPFASWPAFVPAGLEMTFLFAAAAAVLAMLLGNRLPRWYHPVFHIDGFARVSQDRYALVVREHDNGCDVDTLMNLLLRQHPLQVDKIPT